MNNSRAPKRALTLSGILFFSVISILPLVITLGRSPVFAQDTRPERVTVEYDQRNDITRISLNPMILASRKFEELRLGAVASYKGKVKIQPKEVALIFISLSAADENKYQTARKLTIVADSERLALGETQWSKQAQGRLFLQSMLAVIPSDTFLQITRAKEVTMRLGLTEVKLTTDQITLLRAAASYMTP